MADDYHEPFDELTKRVRDQHRMLTTAKEELEAIDWYNQRAAATDDEAAAEVLEHAMIEEMEHACMALEWLRKDMPALDKVMRKILFKSKHCVADSCLRDDDGVMQLNPRRIKRMMNPRKSY
jgi:hypothetical protein